jgi:hypothetical protein
LMFRAAAVIKMIGFNRSGAGEERRNPCSTP